MGPAAHRPLRHFGFVYINSFGSHQCGSILQLGGRRALGRRGRGREERRAGKAEARGRRGQPSCPASAASAASTAAAQASTSVGPQASRAPRRGRLTARAGISKKNAAKTYDFPVPSPEASEKREQRKKASVWKHVSKVISRMMEENEKYRLRLNCPKPTNTNATSIHRV
ncbi:uncharacterized protein C5orf47 homolog [Dipodomys merriami]|uniref:uncharacterized protein C5orf47 homolog n=1 Tax=Dipodomys merriami TaxID=94247 RepID=UPI0038559204